MIPPDADRDPPQPTPLGSEVPIGTRFIGPEPGAEPNWRPGDAPDPIDLDACVACGLCLPHCPTYRLTGEESASPRGRIAAMRAVDEGTAIVDDTFGSFMDLCLVCRACEDVCPSHVPFDRIMQRSRAQIEPNRSRRSRALRRLGLDVVLPRRWLLALATSLAPVARPLLPRRVRSLIPTGVHRGGRLPPVIEPPSGVAVRGTVAMLAGCVQDQWFRPVNRSTIRVLRRNGWRVLIPRTQTCCGALHAHNGRLDSARSLARSAVETFGSDVDAVIVNAAGCGAHLRELGDLLPDDPRAFELSGRVRDLMEFLHETGIETPERDPGVGVVAYHDACHALRALHVREQPRELLRRIPGVEVADLANGDRCCGAAGLYSLFEPEVSGELRSDKADAIIASGARTVASANPGCVMQLAAGLRDRGVQIEVVHPVQLLDRAYFDPSAGWAPGDGLRSPEHNPLEEDGTT
ncbi:MAG: (Fe-S)-binding protein [Actinomycetota bacterium]